MHLSTKLTHQLQDIPVWLTVILIVTGFATILSGITVLQIVGIVALLAALTIPLLGTLRERAPLPVARRHTDRVDASIGQDAAPASSDAQSADPVPPASNVPRQS